ncbi:MAG: DUF4340 domain-containing protein [Acidobacteriota bacterium]
MKLNRTLLIVALALCALSVFSYTDSVRRAERFERGQKFLQNLNPDSIVEILIEKGDESTHLRRDGDRFVVVDADGYPAKNESVNRFIRDVLDISLEKEVGTGESLLEELELVEGGENTTKVVFKDANQAEMVHFLVGKGMDDGGGNYVLRTDDDDATIYLTSSRAYINTDHDSFLKKEIVNVDQADIAAIQGPGFAIEDQDGSLQLVDLPAGKKESSKVGQVKGLLTGLRFTKHYLANAPEIAGLLFDAGLDIDLKDESGYQVEVANKGDKHYLRIQGFHSAGQLSIALDAGDEETAEVADQLKRQNEIQDFNDFHGSWIYEVTETTADRVRVSARDLVEDA